MFDHFDYEIITLQSRSPSDYAYLARLGTMIRHVNNHAESVFWSEHRIPEMWGMTEDEAYNKLEHAIKAWIATQK